MSARPTLIWFRNDLRLADHPGIAEAHRSKAPLVFVYICERKMGTASSWWLYHSLRALDLSLKQRGAKLILREGSLENEVGKILEQSGAAKIFWSRTYEPALLKQEEALKKVLQNQKVESLSFKTHLITEPWNLQTQTARPFQVFKPFYKSFLEHLDIPKSIRAPKHFHAYAGSLESISLEDLDLLSKIKRDRDFDRVWKVGEEAAQEKLKFFLKTSASNYHEGRDYPAQNLSSRFSPHLHFGEISASRLWHELKVLKMNTKLKATKLSYETFLREVAWREFAYHILYHFPHVAERSLRREYEDFPWVSNENLLEAWKKGLTGYPIVDAGMRQLWKMGWMPNRIRMIVASFLTKDLLIPWQRGAEHFLETLVDADIANNSLGWQWAAGSGADAAPYFRIFNPILQGEKFDAEGTYIREWIPEIKGLPSKFIHKPWKAPEAVLEKAGVRLGEEYPHPIIDHQNARDRALQAFKKFKGGF